MTRREVQEAIDCNVDLIMCMRFAPTFRSVEAIAMGSGLTEERVSRVLAWGAKRGVAKQDADGGWSAIDKPLAFENPFAKGLVL